MIKVLFFGPVAEQAGARELSVPFHTGMKLQDVHANLQAQYPAAFALVRFMAVNQEHVRDMATPLTDNSEVVFMSNFSGG